jgi:hypothetical protein
MMEPYKKEFTPNMDEAQNKRAEEALKRAQAQKRPVNLSNDGTQADESLEDEAGFERPERVEHTSEKEHPPGKE